MSIKLPASKGVHQYDEYPFTEWVIVDADGGDTLISSIDESEIDQIIAALNAQPAAGDVSTCGTCAFFEDDGEGTGTCRRHAPERMGWPDTDMNQRCGDWAAQAQPDAGDVEALRSELRSRMAPFGAWSECLDAYRSEFGRTATEEQNAKLADLFARRESAADAVIDYVINLLAAREAVVRGALEQADSALHDARMAADWEQFLTIAHPGLRPAHESVQAALAQPASPAAERVMAVVEAARKTANYFSAYDAYCIACETDTDPIESEGRDEMYRCLMDESLPALAKALRTLDGGAK